MSPQIKHDNVARFGATLRVVDGYYDEAQVAAERPPGRVRVR